MKQTDSTLITTPQGKPPTTAASRGTCTVALKLDTGGSPLPLVQLLPLGRFRARDGRPTADYPALQDWLCDTSVAQALIARFNAEGMPLLLDYEHQTLLAEENGQPAPASGWGTNLQLLDDGLYVEVEWTERARAMIRAGEYRFISPVFTFDEKSGAVLKLLHVALTNYPALTGQRPVAAKHNNPQEFLMPLKPETAALLGVAADASVDDIHAAVTALKSQKPPAADPANYVPIASFEALKGELAALTARQRDGEVDKLIEAGRASGKLLAAQEQWARDLGKKDVAALRSYLDSTPAIAALMGNQTHGKAPAAEAQAALTDAQKEALRIGGWDVKLFKAGEAN